MILEVIGVVVGLIYLWLEYKASLYLWIAGIVMPAIYIVVYYQAGLYADCGIQVYYLLAAVYGLALWLLGRKAVGGNDSAGIRQLDLSGQRDKGLIVRLGVISLLLTVAIAQVLIFFTDSTVPWLDSLTTSLSIVAMWLLAKKYAEQWVLWIVVDVISAGLYVYKELYFTAGLYALYALIALLGYRKWVKLAKENSLA